ncbi:Mitochondrial import receptor subunit TOM20-like protein [Dirofilaria immitis]|nr:Mitochondrial import receptor subunit TOM20-like protein [Dirofilaria immitis]
MGSESFLSSAFSRQRIITAAGIAAAAFIGYCIYFDHKGVQHLIISKKYVNHSLIEALVLLLQCFDDSALHLRSKSKKKQPVNLPNPQNATEMQAFFLQEVQLGEELLADGHTVDGIEHLCNAITMCGQPAQLIQIFQQTLPSEHFTLLVQKLPEAKARLNRMFGNQLGQTERLQSGADDGDNSAAVTAPNTIEISDDLELE